MYDLVNLYKGLTEKQRQDLNLESRFAVVLILWQYLRFQFELKP